MDVVGRSAQPQDLRVISDRHVHFVFARREQQGVASRTELVILLYGVDLVDLLLYRSRAQGRLKHEHVRPEIRLRRPNRRRQPQNQPQPLAPQVCHLAILLYD